MKSLTILATLFLSLTALAQNHSIKPIRFIFESIHDHLGNLDINSKKVMLFGTDNQLVYEADLLEGKELDETFYYYSEDRKLERLHRNFHQPHESGDFKMTYDSKGNLIEETNYDDQGNAIEKITLTYTSENKIASRKVEFFHKSVNGMITEEFFEYTYGPDGKIASKIGFEGEHEERTVTYKYVHTATSETETEYNMRGDIVDKLEIKYDSKGLMTSRAHSTYEKGVASTMTIEFTYDDHGHILTESMSRSGSSIKKVISFEYVYDKYGNWIERKEKIKKGAKETEGNYLKRTIEYYEHDEYLHHPMELDESFNWEKHDGKAVKVFQESHVRINNNDGQVEWVVRRNGSDLFQVDEFEYKAGKLTRINHLIHKNGHTSFTVAEYNDAGYMFEKATYSSEVKKDEIFMFNYDDKGRVSGTTEQALSMTGDMETVLSATHKYDDEGRIVKTSLEEFGNKYSITYEYNEAGKLVKRIETPSSKDDKLLTTVYVYENDNMVEEQEFEGKSKSAANVTKYEYNSEGEMIKHAHYRGGEIHSEVDYIYLK